MTGITFSDLEVRRDYLVRHTVDLALQAWDDPETFADFFEDAQYRTSKLRNSTGGDDRCATRAGRRLRAKT